MAILKLYSKLINDNLPNYFESITLQLSAGKQHYNFRNPSRLLPKIKHEFPKQSLRYKLISTINETSNELLEKAKTLSQKNFINFVKNEIVTDITAIHVNFIFAMCANALRFVLFTMC